MRLVPDFLAKPKETPPKESRPLVIAISRGEGQPRTTKAWSYGITPLGIQKVSSLGESDPRYLILATVKDEGACTIGEVAEKIHISPTKVDHLVNGREGLLQAGCLKRVHSGGE